MTASTTATHAAQAAIQTAAIPAPLPGIAQHLTALGLALVTTLAMLSAMTGLADGYRTEQQLAQAQAASAPVAAAQIRKAPRG